MDIEAIKNDYYSDMLIKDICEKHHITKYQLSYLRKKQGWQPRNPKGAKGNRGNTSAHGIVGNQNAMVTGAYSKLMEKSFSADEIALFNEPLPNKKEILEKEIVTLTIRESRMLEKIKELKDKNKDLTVMQMSKFGTTTSTQAENTQLLINRMEDGLTKIQEALRRAVDSLHKICIEDEEKKNQDELNKLDEILNKIGGVI